MKKFNRKKYNINKNKKDTFGAHLLKNAHFFGYYDMPIINVKINFFPKKLVAYSKLTSEIISKDTFCHFYEYDYLFDGRDGVWNSLTQGVYHSRGFNPTKFEKISGIISPDYSCYMDLPRVMQIWNIYRSRVVCYYLNQMGYLCIPNIRWTDEESYKYAFDGISKGSAVAVGTLGCLKETYDKYLFINGFKEMIDRIKPSVIIIYGSLNKEIIKLLNDTNQKFIFFQSDVSKRYSRRKK